MITLLSKKNQEILKSVDYFINHTDISITKCAERFNIHRSTLANRLKQLDVLEDRRKYKVDQDYFDVINTNNKAYWLGFILADGCLKKDTNQLSIGLSYKDRKHLEKFRTEIKSNKPISNEKATVKNKIHRTSYFRINNKKMYNDLLKYNVCNNKSCNEKPVILEQQYSSHYIRGIYDGDGWISWGKGWSELGFGMGYEILSFIRDNFEKYAGVKNYKIIPYKKIYRYRLTSKKEILKALNYMYDNGNVYLDRKHERFLNFAVLGRNS
ncbi:hypothetical protein IZY60_14185 [Lutibacter sp. B2]|nr:hypothetical protein [Lutibacter sp. B2]